MPSASAGIDSSRMNGSPGTWQVTLYRFAAPERDAKIFRPVTRNPPSTGSALVWTPEVAPAEIPSLNGWL